ncbi:MAG TPA: hypothetical protein VK669_07420 [Candidatus Limnocylindrales bacterium]|nr:hypothetical protein [Candidatus Limnocylindrales bacterium]
MRAARAIVCGFVCASALGVAGCGGAGGAGSLPYICPQTAAGVVSSGALISPANGATGVSPSVGQITFTVGSPDLQGTAPGTVVTLTPASGGAVLRQPDSVITTNGVSSSVIPQLQSGTTYAVTVSATPALPGGCAGSVSASLGSFTTQ